MSRRRAASAPAAAAARDSARAAKLEQLHATLAEEVAALRNGQDWQRWLTVAARLPQYSVNNQLLIAAQRPDATTVAGYGAWKALGRQVNQGETGIAILAPVLSRRTAGSNDLHTAATDRSPAEAATTGVTGSARGEPGAAVPSSAAFSPAERSRSGGAVAGFRVAHVFDIAQTSGAPLPQQPTPHLLAGQAPPGLWDALAAQVAARGFTVQRGNCGPSVNGLTHYRDRTVTVRSDVDDAQAVKTLAHELGHVLLHDPTSPAALAHRSPRTVSAPPSVMAAGPTSAAVCRGMLEVEAESVAYLVAASHGLETGSYTFAYVAGWAATSGPAGAAAPDQVVRVAADRVLATARMVLAGCPSAAGDGAGPAASEVTDLAEVSAAAAAGAHRTAGLLAAATTAQEASTAAGGGLALRDASTQLASGASAEQTTPKQVLRRRPSATAQFTAPDRERLLQVHDLAADFYRTRLGSQADGERALALLAQRGLDADVASRAGVGYAPPGWTTLVDQLRAAGVHDRELLAAGLATTSSRGTLIDRLRDRIIFPVHDTGGRTIAFLGRTVDPPGAGHRDDRVPKYLNSPDTALYRKSDVLYGLGAARAALAAGAVPVLVEGPIDALAVDQASSRGGGDAFVGVAPCGTALTAAQVRLLEQATGGLAERGVVVGFDADGPGRQAAVRAFDLLRQVDAWPHLLLLSDRQDPADLLQRHGPAALHAALLRSPARPLADLVVDQRIDRHGEQLHWAEGRIAAARGAAARIATLPPEHVARQVTRVSARLELPAADVTALLLEAVSANGSTAAPDAPRTRSHGQDIMPVGARTQPSPSAPQLAPRLMSRPRTAAQIARTGFPLPLDRDPLTPTRLPIAAPPATAAPAASSPMRQRR